MLNDKVGLIGQLLPKDRALWIPDFYRKHQTIPAFVGGFWANRRSAHNPV
jgi:hypothetical protein